MLVALDRKAVGDELQHQRRLARFLAADDEDARIRPRRVDQRAAVDQRRGWLRLQNVIADRTMQRGEKVYRRPFDRIVFRQRHAQEKPWSDVTATVIGLRSTPAISGSIAMKPSSFAIGSSAQASLYSRASVRTTMARKG
ncbi:MAG: hypothetical protein WDN31_04320 [Hyphomicrobium sp.]